ncbi:MAG: efflux RND transporter permease subunit [Parachlamydiaceae bacterium]
MIKSILRFSIDHCETVFFVLFFAALYGVYALFHLPIDAVPDITNNQVQINVLLPGYSPEQMEKQVSFVIENELSGIPGLESTRSLSRNGFAQVTAIFDDDVNLYFARQQISERLNAIKEEMPEGAEPKMGPISTGLGEIYMWTVDYENPDAPFVTPDGKTLTTDIEKGAYLRTVEDWIIKPQMQGIKGLAEVDSIGGYDMQYHVQPDPAKLATLSLSFQDLADKVMDAGVSFGPGAIERGGEGLLVHLDERFKSADEISKVVVASHNGIPVILGEVAKVVVGKEMRSGSATKDGHEVVIGTAMMLVGSNSRTVSEAVDARLQEVKAFLPKGIRVETILNRSKLVNSTMHTVATNLAEGAILVVAVLFLFLGQIKAALIVACVIPLTMLLTSIGMVQGNLSGNLMSLGALDFGLIVDGAVIIVENALRRISEKQRTLGRKLNSGERKEEVFSSSVEMIRPSLFGQAIIIVVYVPILALTGVEGKMFHPMAYTVIIALVFAFLLSITFVPAAISLFLRGDVKEGGKRIMEAAERLYRPVLSSSLKFPKETVIITAIALVCSLFLFQRLGQEFVPALDEQDLAMHAIRIPSVSITESTKMQERVEKAVLAAPEVSHVFSKTGTAELASDPMPPNVSDTFIMLKDKKEWPNPSIAKDDLIKKIEAIVQKVPGNQYEFTQPIEMRFNELISGVKSDVAIKFYGDDYAALARGVQQIAKKVEKIPGAKDVKVGQTEGLPTLSIRLNRDVVGPMGLNSKEALSQLSGAIGGVEAGFLFEGDRRVPIFVRLSEEARNSVNSLQGLPLQISDSASGKTRHITFGEIASFNVQEGLNEIGREDGKRFIAVEVNVRGSDLGSFVAQAKESIYGKIDLPKGSWIQFGGQFEHLESAKQRLMLLIPLCLLLILLLLYSALQSLRDALLVFSAIPMALTGGILSLYFRGIPFSISAAVGFIALSGIAVLNGLVLISAIRGLLTQGLSLEEAIRKGAMVRLRPVLMTALVASLGFIPMALSHGTGAEVQRPLATVVIGGLFSSTLLTLLVLPALYALQYRRKLSPAEAQ